MCQRRANVSAWLANVPKGVPIFQLHLQKGLPIFQLFFQKISQYLNLSIMLNICKFREYLDSSRELISRNKEFKFWHLQNFIKEKPYQPKTFDIVFHGERGITRTVIQLTDCMFLSCHVRISE